MKKNNFLFLASLLLGLFLISCDKNDVDPQGGGQGEEGNAYASFSITLPRSQGSMSKAADGIGDIKDGATYEGSADEQKVNSVRIALFDGATVAYTFDYAITAAGDGNPFDGTDIAEGTTPTATKFVTVAKPVAKKDYEAAIILNPTAAIKQATNKGASLELFKAAVSSNAEAMLSDKAILMSNEQGLIPVKEADLKDTKAAAEAAPVKGKVDRILAKVFLSDAKPEVKGEATFTDMEFTLDVTNKKTFWLRNLAQNVVDGTATAETIGDGSERANRYATDPNFDAKALDENNFAYLTTDAPLASAEGFKPAGLKDADGIYCLENTMDAEQQYHAASTSVILKGKFTPKGFTEGENWMSFFGAAYPKAKIEAFLAALESGDDNVFEGQPTGLKEAITANKDKLAGTESFKSDDGINFYTGGICYYRLAIRHFSNEIQPKAMAYGRFGVVRNNAYKVKIGVINGPGEPVITPPNPGTPDEDDTFVAFEVEVNPWLVREHEYEI